MKRKLEKADGCVCFFLFVNRLVWARLRAMQCAIGAWLMAAMSVGVCDIRCRGFELFLMFSPAPHALPAQPSGGDETIPEKRSGRLCPRILSFYRFRKNSGATAIGGMFRTRSTHRSASITTCRILTARPSSRSVNSRYQSVDRSIASR